MAGEAERWQRNDPRCTEGNIWLNVDCNFENLTQSLESNTTLQSVSILYTYRQDLLQEKRPTGITNGEALLSFWEALGKLPSLRKISITGPSSRSMSFDVTNLAILLNYAHYCTKLSVGRLFVNGSEHDWKELETAIRCHQHLQEVYLQGSLLFGGTSGIPNAQERLLQSLSGLSTLKTLTLNGTGASYYSSAAPYLSQQSMAHLCHSKTLERLFLYDFAFDDNHLLAVYHAAMSGATSLKELRLSSCNLGGLGMASLSRLVTSMRYLEVFQLWVKHFHTHDDMEDSCCELARAIGNSSLREFRLVTSFNNHDGPNVFCPSSQRTFCNMLHNNYQLEVLQIPHCPSFQNEMSFYLKLNRLGRKRLLTSQPEQRKAPLFSLQEEWINALVASRRDISCLYYFLSLNPSICQ